MKRVARLLEKFSSQTWTRLSKRFNFNKTQNHWTSLFLVNRHLHFLTTPWKGFWVIYLMFFSISFISSPKSFLRSKFYGGSCPTLEKIFLTTSVSEGIYPEKILKSVQRLDYIYIFLSKYKRVRILLPIKSLNVTGTQPKQSQQQMFSRLS